MTTASLLPKIIWPMYIKWSDNLDKSSNLVMYTNQVLSVYANLPYYFHTNVIPTPTDVSMFTKHYEDKTHRLQKMIYFIVKLVL